MTRSRPASIGRTIAAGALGLAAAVLSALVSIYNPHAYAEDPLFQPEAVRNTLVAVAIAVPLAWLFGRKWSGKLVNGLLVTGLVLLGLAIVSLLLAAAQPMSKAGPFLTVAAISAAIAIPCNALLTMAILKQGGPS